MDTDVTEAYTTIVECLPLLDDSHLKKVRHILNTLYGKESTPSLEESNEEAADLAHFYKVFREKMRHRLGINLPDKVYIGSDALKQWIGVREFADSFNLVSPVERVAVYSIFANVYLNWMIDARVPFTKITFLKYLDRIPGLVNIQLPALSNPFVRKVLLARSGVNIDG